LADARLSATGTAGTYANATHVPVITTDAKGRVTAVTNTAISFPAEADTLQTVTTRGSTTTNAINVTNTTSSISNTTGALIVAGGIGITGNLYSGNIVVPSANSITAGSIQNTPIGDTTAAAGAFTTLSASTSVSFSPSGAVTLNPTTLGSINNMTIGGTTAAAITGTTITDSIGNVRTIVQNAQSGAGSYTLVATDAGKHIYVTGTGGVTMPVNIFTAGQAITIVNNTAASITITGPAAGTMYLAGTGSTGNRTLAQRGIATVLFVVAGATPTIIASGAGLS
jgi:hypothetical protein